MYVFFNWKITANHALFPHISNLKFWSAYYTQELKYQKLHYIKEGITECKLYLISKLTNVQ